jgi:hypothetical protein
VKCEPADRRDCLTVAIYIKAELEFIIKPVYALLLEVKVRNDGLNFTGKVINKQSVFHILYIKHCSQISQ